MKKITKREKRTPVNPSIKIVNLDTTEEKVVSDKSKRMKNDTVAKKRKPRSIRYLFNIRKVKDTIAAYGYTTSTAVLFQYYCSAVVLGFIVSSLYKLPVWGILVSIVACMYAAVMLVLNKYYNQYQTKRFEDANNYIETMLSAFKRSRTILQSLKDVSAAFSEGEMKTAIDQAIAYLENEKLQGDENDADSLTTNEELKRKALQIISDSYNCKRINTLHKFLIIVESQGGDCESYLTMLANDKRLWHERCEDAQIVRNSARIGFIISVVLSAIICLIPFYLGHYIKYGDATIDISSYNLINIGTVVFIVFSCLYLIRIDNKFCSDWLSDFEDMKLETAQSEYRKFMDYDPHKGFVSSLITGAIVLVGVFSIYFFVKRSVFVLCIGLVIFLFVLRFREMLHRMRFKYLKKRYEEAIPFWIMTVTLYLQSRSVRSAISDSYEDAPNAIKPALDELLLGLESFPEENTAYNLFLKDFQLTEVSQCMQSLYTISKGTSKDDLSAFNDMVYQSSIVMDRSEKIKVNNQNAVYNTAVLIPVVVASFKLMIDLTAFIVLFTTLITV